MEKEKLKSWEYRGHHTFWWNLKKIYKIERPLKYCVVFNTYTDKPGSFSVTPFDTLEEALEEAKLINIMYSNTPKPQKIHNKLIGSKHPLDYSNGAYFWGYMVLDMINNKVVKNVNIIKHCGFIFNSKITLDKIDVLFRGEDEIPEDYIWDDRGEYEGWLQFRWGDKKNALDYVEPENNDKIIKPIDKTSNIIDENDYSLQEWALSEEIAGDEYLDNGGTFKPESTSNSLADMLGEDNPLLKLKFN